MIHEFALKNFFSFSDETVVSFSVGANAPDNDLFFRAPSNQRMSKILAVLGANASGKTNLLKGLAFLKYFMLSTFRMQDPKAKIPVDRFAFTSQKDNVLSFRLVVEVDGVVYRYETEMSKDRVTKETLEKRVDSYYRYLYRRLIDQTGAMELKEQGAGFDVTTIKGLVRDNCSVLSAVAQTSNEPLRPLIEYLSNIGTNVDRFGREAHRAADNIENLFAATEFYHRNPEHKQQAEELLSKTMDFGLAGVEIEEAKVQTAEKGETKVVHLPYSVHNIDGKEYKLPMMMESNGTQNSYILLHQLLPVLKTGGLAVIDELEVDLHPMMIPVILDLFINQESNTHNAQLIFSTHSIEVLRKLDKTQIVLVSKDEKCRSSAFRLDSIRGVRRDVDLYSKYMSGAFGAVPNL